MVHVRLNERETNPNPHINFITTLPMPDAADQEDARQLLRALAAQVRPVMKAHGFVVNSFEEYEYNKVFAGRNWNSGEVVGRTGAQRSQWVLPVIILADEHIMPRAGPSTQLPKDEPEEDEDSDVEIVEETDQERRRAMLDASTQNDLDDMKSSRTDFSSDFIFPPMSSNDDEGPSCDIQVLPRPSATAASGTEPSTSRKGKQRASLEVVDLTEEETTSPSSNSDPRKKAKRDMPYGNLIQDEMKQRKLESLGLTGSGQRLGGDRKAPTRPHTKASGPASGAMRSRSGQPTGPDQHQDKDSPEWTCLVCTL
ncbi:hypothetical protein EVJ58_g3042 [Rhodofomes roseus]|uniref:WLM domain-containing protein n=1 Tax=Rhodofomes roseus TaxID=34475 RepID=A0A4Y9YPV2_9APHY|nr:hypothetical protein EVJ58_g3042 [Rhodofomes roseus]